MDAILRLQSPTQLTKLQPFLGLCNVRRQFVSSLAQIAAPLSQHLKENQPTTFTPVSSYELLAMETLKNTIISPLILALPYSGGQKTLDIDLCNVRICCILLQNNWTIRTSQSGIGPVLSRTLKGNIPQPNAFASQSYRPFFCYNHILKVFGSQSVRIIMH